MGRRWMGERGRGWEKRRVGGEIIIFCEKQLINKTVSRDHKIKKEKTAEGKELHSTLQLSKQQKLGSHSFVLQV